MATMLILRPPSIILSHGNHRIFSKPSLFNFHGLSLFSTASTDSPLTSSSQTPASPHTLAYGPSLLKGTKRVQHNLKQLKGADGGEEMIDDVFDEESFTRVYHVAALRVPSNDCFALENRLRGHLLNWPRIRNIARVPGDEVDEEFVRLLGERSTSDDGGVSLERRMYGKGEGDGELLSPVLYREKLVETFDSRGFVNFRNLAKMSRPDKKKTKKKRSDGGEEGEAKGEKRNGNNEFSVLEVMEDDLEGEDLSGLLGEEFKGRKWRGSTRLLLLDDQHASKGIEELPEAIKVYVPTI